MQDYMITFNALGLCKFLIRGHVTPAIIAEWVARATGWDFDAQELLTAGERLFNLKRKINVGLGISRKDDTLPPRLLVHDRQDGAAAGSLPHLGKMLFEYYQLRDWSPEGIPSKNILKKLGLDDTSDDDNTLKVAFTLAPPFKKTTGCYSFTIELPAKIYSLRDVAELINESYKDFVAVELIDKSGHLTASFMVNGKHAQPKQKVNDGDKIVIYKRIGGG